MAAAPTVVCVLRTLPGRSTGTYRPQHVVHLLAQVERHWPCAVPLRCVVLCDVPIGLGVEERRLLYDWPGWWSKLEMFRPDLQDLGPILYIDLDTMVVGGLADLIAVHALTMLRDFYRPLCLGSGLMLIPEAERPAVWAAWLHDPWAHIRHHRGDQDFLAAHWRGRLVQRWQDVVPGQVVSYKVDVRGRREIGPNVRVIAFHGLPRPWQIRHEEWML